MSQKENFRRALLASLLGLTLAVITNACSGSPTPAKRIKPTIEYIVPAPADSKLELLPLPSQRVVLTSRILDPVTEEVLETIITCHLVPSDIPCPAGTF